MAVATMAENDPVIAEWRAQFLGIALKKFTQVTSAIDMAHNDPKRERRLRDASHKLLWWIDELSA